MKLKRRYPLRYFFYVLLALGVYGWYDYFYGLVIIDAKIVRITDTDDTEKPDLKYLVVSVLSDFPSYFFISDNARRFFHMDPKLCFVRPDGSALVNDDVQSDCTYEEESTRKRTKMHRMERSEFLIPFFTVQTEINGKRIFYNTMVQKRGLWAKFQLIGFFWPPPVESKPFFLSLEPYCKTQPEHCKRIFGW